MMGYIYTGHTEPSISNQVTQTIGQNAVVVLGDDLGVDKFVYASARLDYLNIPFFRDIGSRLFSVVDMGYYPKGNGTVKGSLGFGMSLPINHFMALGLYHNFANFGSKPGDIERTSYLNFTI